VFSKLFAQANLRRGSFDLEQSVSKAVLADQALNSWNKSVINYSEVPSLSNLFFKRFIRVQATARRCGGKLHPLNWRKVNLDLRSTALLQQMVSV